MSEYNARCADYTRTAATVMDVHSANPKPCCPNCTRGNMDMSTSCVTCGLFSPPQPSLCGMHVTHNTDYIHAVETAHTCHVIQAPADEHPKCSHTKTPVIHMLGSCHRRLSVEVSPRYPVNQLLPSEGWCHCSRLGVTRIAGL